MRKDSLKGATNKGILFTIAVLALIGFLVVKIGPIHYNKKALESALTDRIAVEADKMTREELINEIMLAGIESGVPLSSNDITIEYGENNRIIMKVKWSAEADLIVTTYKRDFELVVPAKGWGIEERTRENLNSFPSSPRGEPSSPPVSPAGPYGDRARSAGKKLGGD